MVKIFAGSCQAAVLYRHQVTLYFFLIYCASVTHVSNVMKEKIGSIMGESLKGFMSFFFFSFFLFFKFFYLKDTSSLGHQYVKWEPGLTKMLDDLEDIYRSSSNLN